MNAPRRSASLAFAAASAALLLACSSSSGPSQLQVKLSAPADSAASALVSTAAQLPPVDQIVVNVSAVTAHSTSLGWISLGPVVSPTEVNIRDLQSSFAALGFVNLPAGKVTQIRMVIEPTGNYVVRQGSTTHEPLIVPSGTRTGIKILGPWDVPECTRLSVTLEFDGKHSIEYHQADGTWILRPVIRPLPAAATAITCEPEAPPPPPPAPECSTEMPCPSGEFCDGGSCAPAIRLPINSACTDAFQCISDSCNDGLCAPGAPGAPCQTFRDCASSLCLEGSCG